MTVAEIENSTERDATLQTVIHVIHYGRWKQTGPGTDTQTLQNLQIHKVSNELSATESGKLVLRGTLY